VAIHAYIVDLLRGTHLLEEKIGDSGDALVGVHDIDKAVAIGDDHALERRVVGDMIDSGSAEAVELGVVVDLLVVLVDGEKRVARQAIGLIAHEDYPVHRGESSMGAPLVHAAERVGERCGCREAEGGYEDEEFVHVSVGSIQKL